MTMGRGAGAGVLACVGSICCGDLDPGGSKPSARSISTEESAATIDHHSHFRYGSLAWDLLPDPPGPANTVAFTFTTAFRRNAYGGAGAPVVDPFGGSCPTCAPGALASVGDIIIEGIGGTDLEFGDGERTNILEFVVLAVDEQEGWIFTQALQPGTSDDATIEHTYASPGPFTAQTFACCRVTDARHINNAADIPYTIATVVDLANGNTGSPRSLLPPIVDCPADGVCGFSIVAAEPDGQVLRYRLSNPDEAGHAIYPFVQPGPPYAPNAAVIDPNTGRFTWSTQGATLNPLGETLYSAQITIEELDAGGAAVGKAVADFFLRLVPAGPPSCGEENAALVSELSELNGDGFFWEIDLAPGPGLGRPLFGYVPFGSFTADGVALDSLGRNAFAVASFDSELISFDVATGHDRITLRSAADGELTQPTDVAIDSQDRTLYVTEFGSGELTAISLLDGSSAVVATGLTNPLGVTLSPDDAVAYISGSAAITAVTLATGTQTVFAAGRHSDATIDRGGTTLYAGFGTDLRAIDIATGAVTVVASGLQTQIAAVRLNHAETRAYVLDNSGTIDGGILRVVDLQVGPSFGLVTNIRTGLRRPQDFALVCRQPANLLEIKIPVRWCALQGSVAVTNPGQVGYLDGAGTLVPESSTDDALLRRLARLNDAFYSSQAGIAFRSGATALVPTFPILPDLPEYATEGQDGDVYYDGECRPRGTSVATCQTDADCGNGQTCGDSLEWFYQGRACIDAWETRDPTVTGIAAMNIRRFRALGGNPSGLLGITYYWPSLPSFVVIHDPSVQLPCTLQATPCLQDGNWISDREFVLAHELGHALSLNHGNGIDDDLDGMIDDLGFDDPDAPEDAGAEPLGNLLIGEPGFLTPGQRDRMRAEALLHIPDREVDPVTPPLADLKLDELGDVPPEAVYLDIVQSGVVVDTMAARTTLVLSTVGESSMAAAGTRYVFLLDLDHDATTGGAPGQLSLPGSLAGVELAVSVEVTAAATLGTPTLWRHAAGTLAQVEDLTATASARAQHGSSPVGIDPEEFGGVVSVSLANAARGSMSPAVRFEAVASRSDGTFDSATGDLTFSIPTFPTCVPSRPSAFGGASLAVRAAGFPGSGFARVWLGEEPLGTGTVAADGSAEVSVSIPGAARPGPRPLMVIYGNTAITADCPLYIDSFARLDAPPTPVSGASLTVTVGHPLVIPVQASHASPGEVVQLELLSPHTDAVLTAASGNPAVGTLSWTPGAADLGAHVITLSAADSRGHASSPHPLIIEVVGNRAPVADANGPYGIECAGALTSVVLDGSGSFDPDGDALTYLWEGPFGTASGVRPTVEVPWGMHDVTLRVGDGHGLTSESTSTIEVVDTVPPSLIAVAADPACLWPPNHMYVPYELGANLDAEITDACDPSPSVRVVAATSSEADDGLGDGSTARDIIFERNRFCLRSERSGGGSGRSYQVTLAAVDRAGNLSESALAIGVGVQHDQRQHDCPALPPQVFVGDGDPRCDGEDDEPSGCAATGRDFEPGVGWLLLLWGLLRLRTDRGGVRCQR